jgi:hypothetical protein
MLWLFFAFLTVFSWGVYGVFLHKGQTEIGLTDPVARYKAFLFVGIAYVLVAVIGPLIMLRLFGKPGDTNPFSYPTRGWSWSLIAGAVGAIGAFGVLLAFGFAPNPKPAYVPVVMSIIFAGAPIVNALVSIYMPHGKEVSGFEQPKPLFWVGILLAAAGGSLVALYKPDPIKNPAAGKPAVAAVQPAAVEAPKH